MKLSIKNICLSIAIACLQALPASSQQITKERALEKANRFLTSSQVSQTSRSKAPRKAVQLTLASSSDDYYIFNDEQNGGYVIIGGDERQQDVLGYSPDGHFDAAAIPCNFQSLLDGYASQAAYLRAHPNYTPKAQKRVKGVVIAPLLDSSWGQGAPYYNMCPMKFGDRCITGCVPTAISQIMYYHKWPEKGKGQYSYEWEGETYSADFSQSTYRWDLMLPTYNENSSQESQDAVALLLKDVGYAYNTLYGLSDSGASFQGKSLIDYFDYDQSMRMIQREYYNQEEWDNTIAEELKNNRPVALSGGSPSGGHTMVIDGCDSEGYFHFNFGWDGNQNGYFSTQGIYYNSSQMILVGIKKNEGGKKAYTFSIKNDFQYLPESGMMTMRPFDNGGVQIFNYGRSSDAYETALAAENTATHKVTFGEPQGWASDFRLFMDLPDGDYILYPVARVSGGEWQKIVFYDNRQSFVDLNITNGVRTFANNHIFNGLQDGAYEIDGVYYFLNFETHEATVTYKNDKFDGYSGNVTIPGHITYEGTDFTVTTIGDEAFRECNIGTLTIPKTLHTIEMAFYSANVEKFVFEDGSQLKNLGGLCFNALKVKDMELNLPEGLEKLPSHILQSCYATWISLPSTLTTINGTPFNYTMNLRTLVVNNPTPVDVKSNFLEGTDLKLITLYVPKGCVDSYAQASVWKDFGQIKELEDTATVDGVKYILHDNDLTATVFNAFYVKQDNFTLPSSITCKGKTYTVTDIGSFAFATTPIKNLTIPAGIKYFGEGSFMAAELNSPVLDKLTLLHETPPEVADTKYADYKGFTQLFFESSFWVTKLRVPKGSKDKYLAHSLWKRFENNENKIVEYDPSGIEGIVSDPSRQSRQAVYTLSGVRLNTTDVSTLPKGIYIQAGKVIIR